jgi:hypothetical protein
VVAGPWALRYLGPKQLTPELIEILRQVLPPEARARLAKGVGLAPAWMRAYLRAVAEEQLQGQCSSSRRDAEEK